jgi:putative transcriptional regulator
MSSVLDIGTGMKNQVRQLRTERELSQGQLAAAMCVSRQTINSIEQGRYTPSLPLAMKLARHFGSTVEEVFEDDA